MRRWQMISRHPFPGRNGSEWDVPIRPWHSIVLSPLDDDWGTRHEYMMIIMLYYMMSLIRFQNIQTPDAVAEWTIRLVDAREYKYIQDGERKKWKTVIFDLDLQHLCARRVYVHRTEPRRQSHNHGQQFILYRTIIIYT